VRSRSDFFITGVIDASLKPAGKWPDARERKLPTKHDSLNITHRKCSSLAN